MAAGPLPVVYQSQEALRVTRKRRDAAAGLSKRLAGGEEEGEREREREWDSEGLAVGERTGGGSGENEN